jgi:pilus assembly protein CpaB
MIRRNALLIVGLLTLLAGATLSLLWFNQQRAPIEATDHGAAQISVLAASHPISTDTLLRPDDMRWIELPATEATHDYVVRGAASEEEYIGALARRDFQANEPFLAASLVKKTERSFLAAVLAPEDRAVTISVDASATASGLVLPGDHVDVILTQNLGDRAGDSANREVGEDILKDVRVVAVDQSLSHSSAPVASQGTYAQDQHTPRTVTLELSDRDAQKLIVATQLGKIDLSVRSLQTAPGAGTSPTSPVWAEDVSPAIKSLMERPAQAAAAPLEPKAAAVAEPSSPIMVMRGDKTEIR